MSLLWNVAARIVIKLHSTSLGQEALNQDLDPSIQENRRRRNVPILSSILPLIVLCFYFFFLLPLIFLEALKSLDYNYNYYNYNLYLVLFYLSNAIVAMISCAVFLKRPIWKHVTKTFRQKFPHFYARHYDLNH